MVKNHGTALQSSIEVPQFAEFVGAVVAALPRDMDPEVAQGWLQNKLALRRALRRELVPQGAQTTKPVAAPLNWWEQMFSLAIAAGRFTGFCNTDITGTNFPYVPGDLDDVEEVEVPIDRDMSTADVRALLESKSLEGASSFQLLRWWLRHPERQKDCLVVALGQEYNGSVVYVGGFGDCRKLRLRHVEYVWNQRYAFLAVRKVSGT